jgi:hypothetical protein
MVLNYGLIIELKRLGKVPNTKCIAPATERASGRNTHDKPAVLAQRPDHFWADLIEEVITLSFQAGCISFETIPTSKGRSADYARLSNQHQTRQRAIARSRYRFKQTLRFWTTEY